ncbi:MAG: hypothetical protein PSV36_10520 [Algoriphagus sp.]|nr:hypothetical protein [Algoriphagus sp.]
MAKQTSVITLEGRVGRLSFYKTKDGYLAREKGGVSKSRIMNDPKFARTRENLQEFADNASSSKLLRDALRPVVSKIGDSRLNLRITQAMMKVLKTDLLNTRGDRKVREGDWNLMKGMEMNASSSLGSTIFMEIVYTDSPTAWEAGIAGFIPQDFLAVPRGATHSRISATGVGLDFTTGIRTVQTVSSPLLPLNIPALAISLPLNKTTLTGTHRAFVLAVEFIQLVNGVEYAINNGANNAAAIITTEKV